MFLIEYDKGSFVDGETINWVKVTKESVMCTQTGDAEHIIEVTKEYQLSFVNNLGELDGNMALVEKRYHELRK